MNKSSILAAPCAAAVLFFAGCLQQPEEKAQDKSELAVSAATLGGTWHIFAQPAQIVAWTNQVNPIIGFGLDWTDKHPEYGYPLWRHSRLPSGGTKSEKVPGGYLIDMDMGTRCQLWGVSGNGGIYQVEDGCYYISSFTWYRRSPEAAIGKYQKVAAVRGPTLTSPSLVYALTNTPITGGYTVDRWLGDQNWETIPNAGLLDIDVDESGTLWGVNNQRYVFKKPLNGAWQLLPYANAQKITVGNGQVYVLTWTPKPGGYLVKKFNGTYWDDVTPEKGFTDLHMAATGTLWASKDYQANYYQP